ncbi:hypothetical protein [Thiocystis violacea]|uniref:hypothetical protein n=1 Tax=Thiocystis violacea TaxID=13725 RepID=UPI001905A083|nr:hypothetical protein [Thiocystis violacea]MBK1718507.1 hypothetical protein [Thiocystis violacea]
MGKTRALSHRPYDGGVTGLPSLYAPRLKLHVTRADRRAAASSESPFFFSYAKHSDARQTYAVVLNWFMGVFLLVVLVLDVRKLVRPLS